MERVNVDSAAEETFFFLSLVFFFSGEVSLRS